MERHLAALTVEKMYSSRARLSRLAAFVQNFIERSSQ
jgi:hypothetical protein